MPQKHPTDPTHNIRSGVFGAELFVFLWRKPDADAARFRSRKHSGWSRQHEAA